MIASFEAARAGVRSAASAACWARAPAAPALLVAMAVPPAPRGRGRGGVDAQRRRQPQLRARAPLQPLVRDHRRRMRRRCMRRLDALERDAGWPRCACRCARSTASTWASTCAASPAPSRRAAAARAAPPVATASVRWRRWSESGVPLLAQPYAAWAEQLGMRPGARHDQALAGSRHAAPLRRGGAPPRTRFRQCDDGVRRARRRGRCARRPRRAAGRDAVLPPRRAFRLAYNLYCMVHGRERDQVVRATIDSAARLTGIADRPHEVLFSRGASSSTGRALFQPVAAGGSALNHA